MNVNTLTDERKMIGVIQNLSFELPKIISIDGVDGVGKSSLAQKMSDESNLQHLEIDNYIQKQQGGYIDHIDYSLLTKSIRQFINAKQGIVLEGVCVQQVLKKINLASTVKIYIRMIDEYGLWMHQMLLFPPDKSADEVIAERKAKRFPLGHMEDIIRYHYTFKPYESADYIFERQKS